MQTLLRCTLSILVKLLILFLIGLYVISSSHIAPYNINSYVINWMITFLIDRKQRVVVDGITTKFTEITGGPSSECEELYSFFLLLCEHSAKRDR